MMDFNILLFDDFETLDAFGPAEIIGQMPKAYRINYCSIKGGRITSVHGAPIETMSMDEVDTSRILLIPGGIGTRKLIADSSYLFALADLANKASYVLTVCTGSAVLAASGALDNKRATSNKLVYDWVTTLSSQVQWIPRARWVVDGKFYTSSGVTAGMDMTLGFVSDLHGIDESYRIANYIEYTWHQDKDQDPFSKYNT